MNPAANTAGKNAPKFILMSRANRVSCSKPEAATTSKLAANPPQDQGAIIQLLMGEMGIFIRNLKQAWRRWGSQTSMPIAKG
jgi:hypothetical protein